MSLSLNSPSLGLGITNRVYGGLALPGSSTFLIRDVWIPGRVGVWYDPNDINTLFQDSTGTTPVTAAGQPIGKTVDKSGNNIHTTQATAGSRPVLSAGFPGGETYDGIDDYHTSTTSGGGGNAGFFYCAGIRLNAGGATQTLWSDTDGILATGYKITTTSANKLELAAGNNVVFTLATTSGTFSVGVPVLVTAWDDGVNLNVQLNQATAATTARPSVVAGSSVFTEGRANGVVGSHLSGTLFERVYIKNGGVTATERANVQKVIASKIGVAL